MDAVLAYQQTAAIKAALELDLFSEIGKGNATAESLARTTGAAVRGVRILCDYLTVRGHLEKHGDHYRLTQSAAAFLDRHAPSWMGSVVEYLAAPEMMALFLDDPAAFVRNGGSNAGGGLLLVLSGRATVRCTCPLLALSGHAELHCTCPLLGVKRT